MKQASLLLLLLAIFSLSAFGQTTTIEKHAKRITITTTKVDENGKQVTETWIAEGDQPEQILENMAVNPDVLQKMNGENQVNPADGEQLFIIRSAGDKTTVTGTLNENINIDSKPGDIEKVIIINSNDSDNSNGNWHHKICRVYGGPEGAEAWANGRREKSNCAALGVYVNSEDSDNGTRINSLIEKGGALEAGLKEGDVINKIDIYDVTDFPSLHEALSHYQPGDVVTVRYVRDEKTLKKRVELKDWAQLPGHEWRARTDCGDETVVEEEKPIDKNDNVIPGVQPLELQDASIFPNPTEGVFTLSFSTKPGPIAISINDVDGKVVYHENDDNTTGSFNRDIDLKDLPQGNYIISIKQGDKVYTNQISKQ